MRMYVSSIPFSSFSSPFLFLSLYPRPSSFLFPPPLSPSSSPHLSFSPQMIALSHKGKKVRLYDVRSGNRLVTLSGHAHLIHNVQWNGSSAHPSLPSLPLPLPLSSFPPRNSPFITFPLLTRNRRSHCHLFERSDSQSVGFAHGVQLSLSLSWTHWICSCYSA